MSNNNEYLNRSKRSKPAKREADLELLSKIKRSKAAGINHREEYKEDDIYEFVNEEEYNNLKEKRQQTNFVEDDSEYFDDGKEIFDESGDEETTMKDNKRKKSFKNSNIKKMKYDGTQQTQKSKESAILNNFLKSGSSKKINDDNISNFDDIMADFNKIKGKKTENKIIPAANPFVNRSEKPRFKIETTKTSTKKKSIMIEQENIDKKSIIKQKNHENTDKKSIVKPQNEEKIDKKSFVKPQNEEKIDKKSIVKPQNEEKIDTKSISVLSTVEIDQMNSMDSWAEETMVNKVDKCQIDDTFSDIDFDEPFVDDKGYAESAIEKTRELPYVMWEEDDGVVAISTETNVGEVFQINDDKSVKIYWIDGYYDNKIPGAVFIFGKTYDNEEKAYVNCCVKLTGLERRLYFLPKAGCELGDVYKELVTLFDKYNIEPFRCKKVTKKYAFQMADVPDVADYMMVQYEAKHGTLPLSVTGDTFSHVFGCETSILELLILDLKLKGPCWLNLVCPKQSTNKFSICKLNFEIHGIKGISKCVEKLPNPPLTLLSVNLKTIHNAKTNINEIISIGCFLHNEVYFDQPAPAKVFSKHFTILTQPKDTVMPYDLKQKLKEWGPRYDTSITIASNERVLISNFLAMIQKYDPDLIIGHSLFGNQLTTLLQRCHILNLGNWYQLGRLKRNVPLPKITGKSTAWLERMATAGRLICDVEFSGRELIKVRSYELEDLVKEILPSSFHSLENYSKLGDLSQLYIDSIGVKQIIDYTMDEAISNIHLMHSLQILPLAYQITTLCGNIIARTLSTGKSERNEYLLLHAFNEKDYITPDKYGKPKEKSTDVTDIETSGKRKPTYLGGLVLEPKKGFYENFILLMDFNSLYPSIIQEFNICFSTIDRKEYLNDDYSQDPTKINKLMELAMNASVEPAGILPTEIRKLVESRKIVKALLLQPCTLQEKNQYDIRQKALKITANSMYGCLGFSHSRFQATQLAALITCKGRDILLNTKQFVESDSITYKINNLPTKISLEIVYGDTDSIMVNTSLNKIADFENVMNIGKRIKQEVNKKYKHIQIDIDGVFKRLLLLKKKKYAALTITKDQKTGKIETKQELKGIDIVRRDWCKLAVEVGHNVVTKILEGEMSQEDLTMSISSYLQTVKSAVSDGQLLLDKFVITKALARNPESYSNVQGQPHVQVALRHNKSGATRKYRALDTIEYVICIDGSTLSAAQRAYSTEEVLERKLRVDSEYYLQQQLQPVISRLVEGIEGLSAAVVASGLGLDPRAYTRQEEAAESQRETQEAIAGGGDKFQDCVPLVVRCVHCHGDNLFSLKSPPSSQCSNCKCRLTASLTMNSVTKTVRLWSKAYYQTVYCCQDLLCSYRCRELPLVPHGSDGAPWDRLGQWLCPHCGQGVMRPLVDHSQLYRQILFLKSLFSNSKVEAGEIVCKYIESILKRSSYANVDFSLFPTLLKSTI